MVPPQGMMLVKADPRKRLMGLEEPVSQVRVAMSSKRERLAARHASPCMNSLPREGVDIRLTQDSRERVRLLELKIKNCLGGTRVVQIAILIRCKLCGQARSDIKLT